MNNIQNKGILLLRITFWWGIIADAFEGIRMLIPSLFIDTMNIGLQNTTELKYGLVMGAPVMFGWSLALLWADRKPMERRGIIYSLIPIIVGYIFIELMAVSDGLLDITGLIPVFFSQGTLIILSVLSLFMTRNHTQAS